MKKLALLAFILAMVLPAQATLMQVTGTFNGNPQSGTPSGPVRFLSGGFTAYFDDALVSPTGYSGFDNLSPTEFFLNTPQIGSILFDVTNTYVDLSFHNGTLVSFLVGDINNNQTVTGTDDFLAYFEHDGGLILSQTVLADKDAGFFGVEFTSFDPTKGSFSVSPVPDATSTLFLATFTALGLFAVRRRLPLPTPA